MAQPKILLFGKNGQVGWELQRSLAPFASVVAVDFPQVDFKSASSIREWIRRTEPDIVVNAAAYTEVEKAEAETGPAMQINGEAPEVMADELKTTGALLVHYSTDYVYDGIKNSPYTEEDTPNPQGSYGRSKLAGDCAIQNVSNNYIIFRLCWIYGARARNFMLTIMRLAQERERIRVVNDQIGCPTWSRMVAEATTLALQQIRASSGNSDFKGIYHLCASGQTSWHGFAEEILKLTQKNARKCSEIEAISSSAYTSSVKRPANSVMSCAKLERTFRLKLPDWRESLQHVLE